MKRHFGYAVVALIAPIVLAAGAAQAADPPAAKKPMNYDCSKAGNKNKQACKDAAPVAPTPPAAPARAASVPSVRAAPAAVAATTKSGNIVEWKTTTGKIVHYDCDKAGNKTKQACKGR
jgi:large subunit ribosomal protein L22e/Meckel syndrome type 1 protein